MDYPGYNPVRQTTGQGRKISGSAQGPADPTNEPGQYPPGGWGDAIFGGPQPTGTGAPGTAGASGATDPTNEPGQVDDGLTGLSEHDITDTGAPGTAGATANLGTGPDSVTFTRPNAGLLPLEDITVNDYTDGPQDWTQANDSGYATGGPQLPGIKGNEPEAGQGRYQPGGAGHVMRGGRAVQG